MARITLSGIVPVVSIQTEEQFDILVIQLALGNENNRSWDAYSHAVCQRVEHIAYHEIPKLHANKTREERNAELSSG